MPKNKIIVVLGALTALLPVLGFPHSWESLFQVVVGLSLILLSIWGTIDKRLTLKAKAQKRQLQKQIEAELEAKKETEVTPSQPEPSL